jgi:hypothetical protein
MWSTACRDTFANEFINTLGMKPMATLQDSDGVTHLVVIATQNAIHIFVVLT